MKKIKKYTQKSVKEFLYESNAVEGVYGKPAFLDSELAWNYLALQTKLSKEVILETHRLLMTNLYPEVAGKWRSCDVWIGGKRKFFVSVQLIAENVDNFLVNMGVSSDLPEEDLDRFTINCHVAFEELHPFVDGNGRTGRLIMNWHRQKLGLPIKIIHADWDIGGDEQRSYYKWFR